MKTGKVRADTTVVSANVEVPDRLRPAGRGGGEDRPAGPADQGRRRCDPHRGSGTVAAPPAAGCARSPRSCSCAGRRPATRRRPRWLRITGELADLADAGPRRGATRCCATPAGPCPAPPAAPRAGCGGPSTSSATTLHRAAAVVAQTRLRLAGGKPDSATRLVSLHDPRRPADRARAASTGRSSSATRPRSSTTTTASSSTTPSRKATPPTRPQLAPAIDRIHQPHRPSTARGGRRPRLRRSPRRDRTARPRRENRCHTPQRATRHQPAETHEHTTGLPRPRQMAHRLRRPHQPPVLFLFTDAPLSRCNFSCHSPAAWSSCVRTGSRSPRPRVSGRPGPASRSAGRSSPEALPRP